MNVFKSNIFASWAFNSDSFANETVEVPVAAPASGPSAGPGSSHGAGLSYEWKFGDPLSHGFQPINVETRLRQDFFFQKPALDVQAPAIGRIPAEVVERLQGRIGNLCREVEALKRKVSMGEAYRQEIQTLQAKLADLERDLATPQWVRGVPYFALSAVAAVVTTFAIPSEAGWAKAIGYVAAVLAAAHGIITAASSRSR